MAAAQAQPLSMTSEQLEQVLSAGANAEEPASLDPRAFFPGITVRCVSVEIVTSSAVASSHCTHRRTARTTLSCGSPSVEVVVEHAVNAATSAPDQEPAGSTENATPPAGGDFWDMTGAALWPASFLVVEWLSTNIQHVRGRNVLELGAGYGMCGIAAAALAARCVVVSDGSETAVAAAAANIAANTMKNATACRCVWGTSPPPRPHSAVDAALDDAREADDSQDRRAQNGETEELHSGFDLIIGSELAHRSTDMATLRALFQTVSMSLASGADTGAHFVTAYAVRGPASAGFPHERLLHAAHDAGFLAQLDDLPHAPQHR